MKRIMKITVIILILVFIAQQLISRNTTRNTETPEYKVLYKYNKLEIREYPAMVLASANLGNSSYSNGSGTGFRTIANYIFGGNQDQQKISMTSPVMMEMGDSMVMSFVMPQKYALESLPEPDDPAVYLHERSSKVVAVITYSGYNNDKKFNEHQRALEQALMEMQIETIGAYHFYGYNPPYEVINRRNEVVVEVKWPSQDMQESKTASGRSN